MTDRQTDIYKYSSDFLSIPAYVPGRSCGTDFLYFKWCSQMAPHVNNYTVVIETLDTAGAPLRGISTLREVVGIPQVHLPSPSRIALIPNSHHLPLFEAELVRGSLYVIPETSTNGRYQMDREGMLRLN